MEKPDFISKPDFELLKKMYPDDINKVLDKINNNYPIQYLIGYVEFLGYPIKVDNRVLIPRFETEMLVSETIKFIKDKIKTPKIIDIATGSGCIAISLSKELNTAVDALDISSSALDLAIENAKDNNANVNFIHKDIMNCDIEKKYNVLISNPPYIRQDEEVSESTKYEPSLALYAHDEGLEFYKIIIKKSKEILLRPNVIAFEIGCTQSRDIINLIKSEYPKSYIIPKKDLNNLDRYIFIYNE